MRMLFMGFVLSTLGFCAVAFSRSDSLASVKGCMEAGQVPCAIHATTVKSTLPRIVNSSELRPMEPGQILPPSTSVKPVPRQYADGYAIYERYGYAVVGEQPVIVDPNTRRVLVTLN
jgi:hypothetical protein